MDQFEQAYIEAELEKRGIIDTPEGWVARAYSLEVEIDLLFILQDIISYTESPIEQKFLLAFFMVCINNNVNINLYQGAFYSNKGFTTFEHRELLTSDGNIYSIDVFPQLEVEELGYRLDFAFRINGDSIIVECDGHDFHEKTKEQATRNKKRDRNIQSLGFKVYRFTGSEIHNEPIKCANEIFGALHDIYKKDLAVSDGIF